MGAETAAVHVVQNGVDRQRGRGAEDVARYGEQHQQHGGAGHVVRIGARRAGRDDGREADGEVEEDRVEIADDHDGAEAGRVEAADHHHVGEREQHVHDADRGDGRGDRGQLAHLLADPEDADTRGRAPGGGEVKERREGCVGADREHRSFLGVAPPG